MESCQAPLTSNEETTLRKIVAGDSTVKRLRDTDIMRLVAMGLIEMTVTDAGLECYRGLSQPAAIPPARKRRARPHATPFFGFTELAGPDGH